jgi:protoporphyrinogen oxidase
MSVASTAGRSSREPHVVILGGGPAGCGAAYELRRLGRARATLLERQPTVGGNSGSFEWAGQWLDFGSHRLHHACDAEILGDIKQLLGDDLQQRPRRGRIRLRGRWLKFPLSPKDLALRIDKGFAAGMARDMVVGKLARKPEGETFASVLMANLGPTMCHGSYFPYARKLWGREPEALSGIQARKRVSAGSFGKLLKRLVKPPGAGGMYYPREGFGQITRAYADAARGLGADLMLGWSVTSVERHEDPAANDGYAWTVTATCGEHTREIRADHVWSTIPTTLLARMMRPAPPSAVLEASTRIDYRAMLLVYLKLDTGQFSTTDAHYFPEGNVRMTRLSEPKNYFGHEEPRDSTVLCAEIPCSPDDDVWAMDDEALGNLVASDMAKAGLPLPRPQVDVHVKRLRQAYPIYLMGYEKPFATIDDWATGVPSLLVFGRQGLFAHDNTHHALYMAYAAARCLGSSGFDEAEWGRYREVFSHHVVED